MQPAKIRRLFLDMLNSELHAPGSRRAEGIEDKLIERAERRVSYQLDMARTRPGYEKIMKNTLSGAASKTRGEE